MNAVNIECFHRPNLGRYRSEYRRRYGRQLRQSGVQESMVRFANVARDSYCSSALILVLTALNTDGVTGEK